MGDEKVGGRGGAHAGCQPPSLKRGLSAGLSYDVSDNFTVDMAYTHVFIDDADIDTRQPGGLLRTIAAQAIAVADRICGTRATAPPA